MSKPGTKSRSGAKWTEAQHRDAGRHQLKLRLPLDAIDQLRELAAEGEVSMSEIVDSLVRLEWAKSPGRKLRTKADGLAAFVARGE